MRYLIVSFLFVASISFGQEIYRIELGKSSEHSSNEELRMRVWSLERAVAQLQDKVFQLSNAAAQTPQKSWTCTTKNFGKTYTATKPSRGEAKGAVLQSCGKDNSIGCEDDLKCEE